MATLDELFDTAGTRLRMAAATPSPDHPAAAPRPRQVPGRPDRAAGTGGEDAPQSP